MAAHSSEAAPPRSLVTKAGCRGSQEWHTANALRVRGDRKEAERRPQALPPTSACEDFNSQRPRRLTLAL